MKWQISGQVVIAVCLVVCITGSCLAQADQSATAEGEAMMQKWVDFMTPGAEHELLGWRVGKWDVTIETRESPTSTVMTSNGNAEVAATMGGRYFVTKIEGKFGDQPFSGESINGYDRLKKKYVAVWLDNLGTGFTISTGSYDAPTKTYNYWTMSPDVELGRYKGTRMLERILSDDQWVVEIYDTTDDGKEFLMMKAVYQRAKP